MIEIKADQILDLELELERMGGRAIPYAQNAAINGMAFDARRGGVDNIEASMTLRNSFTKRSVIVDKSRRPGGVAKTGSTAAYLAVQETGAVLEGGSIPTPYASGEGENARPRRRLPRKPNKMRNITLRNANRKGKTRAQRNLAAIQSGEKYVYLETRRGPAIFRVLGSKRALRIRMVQDLSRRSVVVPRNPWLEPAANAATARGADHFAKALLFQLERNRR